MRTIPTIILFFWIAGTCAAQQPAAPQDTSPDSKPATTQTQDQGKGKAGPSDKSKGTPADKGKTPGSGDQKSVPAKGQGAAAPPAGAAGDQNEPPPLEQRFPRKLPPMSSFYSEAGYADWGLSGSEHKFRQYGTPPAGWFLRDLRFVPIFKTPTERAFFDMKGPGQDDYYGETRLDWGYGNTQLAGFLSQARFFDPTPQPVDLSSRRVNGLNGKQFINRDFALSFRYRDDFQDKFFEQPYPALRQETQYLDTVAGGKLGPGYLSLLYGNLHYTDHTGTLVNTTTETLGFRYLWEPAPTVSLEAAASHVFISQPGRPQSHVDTLALSGDFAMGASTDLQVNLEQRQIGLPAVQSAYVRSQGVGSVAIYHRWLGWRAQLGLRLQNDERVNGDHTFVDVPKWSTVEGRLAGRLGNAFKFTLRGYTEQLSDAPTAITEDTRSLYWTHRDYVQARLERNWPNVDGYLVYTYRKVDNSARNSEVLTHQVTVGGTWEISPTLNLFAEYDNENWSGKTDLDAFPTLNNFLPDTSTGVIELTWNRRSRIFMSASYTNIATINDNPLLLAGGNYHANFLTITTRYRFPAGYEVGLIVAPWYYRDTVASALNYNATILMLTGAVRF